MERASSEDRLQVEREQYLKTISELQEELETNRELWRKEMTLAVENVSPLLSSLLSSPVVFREHVLTSLIDRREDELRKKLSE